MKTFSILHMKNTYILHMKNIQIERSYFMIIYVIYVNL